jgi:GNAT superfamily N-acetyltransferase
MNSRWIIRPAATSDISFVYSTWLRVLRTGNTWFGEIDRKHYYSHYKIVLSRILSQSEVRMLCLKVDPDIIIGYLVCQGPTLHWVYVKPGWRGIGVAKHLINGDVFSHCTHLTQAGARMKRNLPFKPL